MSVIYKYPFGVRDEFVLDLPLGARILSVQTQRDEPCIWALVDPAAPSVSRRFRLVGTGHHAPDVVTMDFIGTFQVHGGALVFHLFAERAAGAEAEADTHADPRHAGDAAMSEDERIRREATEAMRRMVRERDVQLAATIKALLDAENRAPAEALVAAVLVLVFLLLLAVVSQAWEWIGLALGVVGAVAVVVTLGIAAWVLVRAEIRGGQE